VKVEFDRARDGMEVLSTVMTPRVLAPERVERIQDALSKRLEEPVRLFMRCNVTKDVTATGSTNLRPFLSLYGTVTEAPLVPEMRLLQQAEQVAREVASRRPEIALLDVDLVWRHRSVLIVSVQTPRDPEPEAIARFEAMLRERLGAPNVQVVIRRVDSTDLTAKGKILYGAAHLGDATDAEVQRRQLVEQAVRERIEALPDLFVTAIDAVRAGSGWACAPGRRPARARPKRSAVSSGAPDRASASASGCRSARGWIWW
jgi:hypothetical protein